MNPREKVDQHIEQGFRETGMACFDAGEKLAYAYSMKVEIPKNASLIIDEMNIPDERKARIIENLAPILRKSDA